MNVVYFLTSNNCVTIAQTPQRAIELSEREFKYCKNADYIKDCKFWVEENIKYRIKLILEDYCS